MLCRTAFNLELHFAETQVINDIIDKIYEYGKENHERIVYRFCKRGIINDLAFLNSYDEYLLENREIKDSIDNVITFSTSCSLTDKKPKQLYKLIKKKGGNTKWAIILILAYRKAVS